MTDLEIRYPTNFDLLPFTTQISVNVGDNINALRDAILNLQHVLGLNINVGLFSSDPTKATVAERLIRLERGIAERNLVFKELNVSDALQVLLTPDSKPFVRLGLPGFYNEPLAPVTIVGPLTILAPAVENPLTRIQTPVEIDVSVVNPEASSFSLIKGRSNSNQPLLTIEDTNSKPQENEYALNIKGNVKISGKLTADYSIDHGKLFGTETVPTNSTRGLIKHVTQGDWHSHRKKSYDETNQRWTVDSAVNTQDYGIIRHSDLVGIGTLPTHGDEFIPAPGVNYHVTGGDTHDHKAGRGAQIDHNDLKNIDPKFSNHVSGGDSHNHNPEFSDGGVISHTYLSDITTTGAEALHVTGGDNHSHSLDEDGTPVGNGAQIDHKHLKNINPKDVGSIHVTNGDKHSHGVDDAGLPIGDGAQIDHKHLKNISTDADDSVHVTNGDNHSHKNGDGAQISHKDLSDIGTLSHPQLDSKFAALESAVTFTSQLNSTPQYGISRDINNKINFAADSKTIGSVSNTGAWILGPVESGSSLEHTFSSGGATTVNISGGTQNSRGSLQFKRTSSITDSIIGSAGGTNDIIAGSSLGDLVITTTGSSRSIIFANIGDTLVSGKVLSNGKWMLGEGSITNTQTDPTLSIRSDQDSGNSLEWGLPSSSTYDGYASTLGYSIGSGTPFIGFSCEHGDSENTWKTRGQIGSVIQGGLGVGFKFGIISAANQNNQSATIIASASTAGAWTFGNSSSTQTHNLNGRLNFNTTETNLPANGLYRSATNTLAFSTNSTNAGSIGSSGAWTLGISSAPTNKQTLYGEIDGYGTAITLSNSSFANSITHIKNTGVSASLNNAATATFTFGSGVGVFLMITNTTSNNSALFLISNSNSAKISDPSNTFSHTSGTLTSTNITSLNGVVTLQNNTNAAASYKLVAISTL